MSRSRACSGSEELSHAIKFSQSSHVAFQSTQAERGQGQAAQSKARVMSRWILELRKLLWLLVCAESSITVIKRLRISACLIQMGVYPPRDLPLHYRRFRQSYPPAMRDDLLTPSLESAETKPILSVGALIGAAFFGGALAATVIGGDNARRLGRLKKDFIWVLLGLAAGIAVPVVWTLILEPDGAARSNLRIVVRGAGFAMAGIFYLAHRYAYRSMQLTGRASPSPWAPVIAAVIAAIVLQSAINSLLKQLVVAA